MATVIPKKGQIVLTKEAFDAKAAAGELIPGAEYLINNIQYITATEADMILQSAKDYTDIEANKKVDKTSVSESVVANSVVKRTIDGDILVNDDNTAMASKPSNIAVSKGYVQYIMTTLSELFGQNLEAVISSISSSASTDGYTQTLTFKNLNDIGIGTLDIVIPKSNLEIVEDSTLFKYTFTLKDSKGNVLSTKTIDLPLEELVVNGSYNNVTKSIVLTLKNGNTVDIPVGDLVEGLVNSTDLQNTLSNYATLEQVSGKVDKINGKGLSTNDYTDTDKVKLDGLANIKTIGNNLTLDAQGILSANVASGVSSINGQTGAVTGIATTEEVNTAKQAANSYTDTKTDTLQSQIDTLKKLYGVGSIYMSTNSTSPAELFGGTWERIKDKFLLGSGDSYSAGATGGSATHTHNASGFAKISTSAAGFNVSQKDQAIDWAINYRMATPSDASQQTGMTSWGVDTDTTVHSSTNMPPYLAVYIWKRTA